MKTGAAWIMVAQVLSQFMRLASNLVLAWLLTPDAFGMAALAFTFFMGLVLMSDLGTNVAMIRGKDVDDPAFYNTVWTLQVLQGSLLFICCLLLAKPLSVFYNEPDLCYLVMFGGFGLFVQGLRSTSWPVLQREMRLKRLSIYGLVTQVLGASATILYAWIYSDPIALIVGFVVSAVMTTLMSHLLHRKEVRNKLCWNRKAFNEIFHFGKWILVSSLFSFLSQRSDRFMLGKLSSLDVLGVYHVAMMLAELPRYMVHIVSEKLLLPMFAHYARDDVEVLKKNFFLMKYVLLPIMLISCLAIILLSDSFFFFLYHPSYRDAMWIAPCLVLMLWFEMLILSMDRVPVALGDSKLLASMWGLVFVVKIICSFVGYYYFGLVGFIGGLAAGSLVGYFKLALAVKQIGMNVLYQDLKYTLLLLLIAAGYFYLKVVFEVSLYEPNLWLSGMCLLVLIVFGGMNVLMRVRKLSLEVGQ